MVTCASRCQDNTFHMEISLGGHDHVTVTGWNNEDVEVNIVDGVDPNEERVVGMDSHEVTECSSSFGFSESVAENAAISNDVEVESQMRQDNALLLGFNGYSDLFRMRKKRVTPEWRHFIRPLMWRCKWVEMHIKELCSQTSEYQRELGEIYNEKQRELEKYAAEDLGIKSAPASCQNRPVKLMKRRRRKRVEETVDLASYTSFHELFSYFEKRRYVGGFVSVDNDDYRVKAVPAEMPSSEIFGVEDEFPTLDFQYSDAFESILWKIEEAQSQVRQLRVRMDKVVTENAGKFTSEDPSLPPCEPSTSYAQDPISSDVDNRSLCTILQQIAGKKLFVLENMVCNNGEGTPFPDLIDNSGCPKLYENMENEILTLNQPVKQEVDNTEEVGVQLIAEPQLARPGKAGNIENPNSSSQTTTIPEEQRSVKAPAALKLSILNNKRKRGTRKARSGRWNRRSSG